MESISQSEQITNIVHIECIAKINKVNLVIFMDLWSHCEWMLCAKCWTKSKCASLAISNQITIITFNTFGGARVVVKARCDILQLNDMNTIRKCLARFPRAFIEP